MSSAAPANSVTDNDVSLEQFDLFATDDLVLEGSKSSRYAVGYLAAVKQRLHGRRRTVDIGFCCIRNGNTRFARFAISYGDNLFKCKAFAVNNDL